MEQKYKIQHATNISLVSRILHINIQVLTIIMYSYHDHYEL
jgi:hypothetical protein